MKLPGMLPFVLASLALGSAAGLAAEAASDPVEAEKAPTATSPSAADSAQVSVFSKMDDDRDDRISSVEARRNPTLSGAFKKLDTDSDGFLTATEFQQWEEAGNMATVAPKDPALTPSGSRGAQHMPKRN